MVVVTKEPQAENEPLCWGFTEKNAPSYDDTLPSEKCNYMHGHITSPMQQNHQQISSPKAALDTLWTAVRIQNVILVKKCIEILDEYMEPSILINIMEKLQECNVDEETQTYEPSAPPFIENNENRDNKYLIKNLLINLRNNCLLEIDKYADLILKDKEFEKLSYKDILDITTRDTLQVSNELIVYSAIIKWGNAECYRKNLTKNSINLKAVLRDLVYSPRYGLMTKKEFQLKLINNENGPIKSGILDEKEWRRILFYIKENYRKRPVEDLPYKCSLPRKIGNQKPIILSQKSNNRDTNKNFQINEKKCDRYLLIALRCWTAIFD